MAKYRKRPLIINAIQFKGDYKEVFDWISQWHPEDDGPGMWESDDGLALIIDTLEGEMRADNGDWIIRGGGNEIYPIKPWLFKVNFRPITRKIIEQGERELNDGL